MSCPISIERLTQVSKLSDSSTASKTLCSVCLEENQEQEETPTANIYCVECKHNLCEECCREHRKFKATKHHTLMPINEHKSDKNLMTGLAQGFCELHEQNIRNVGLYCTDCKTVECAFCFIEEHKNHGGSHVNTCVDGFRKQIQNNTDAVNECIGQAQKKNAELVKVKEETLERIENLECDIDNRKQQIKQFADKHADRLLQGLCIERQRKLKEIQREMDDTDAYLSN